MNTNRVEENGFSNPKARELYELRWPDEPHIQERYEECDQCGGCAFFAAINSDWGICLHKKSRHCLEKVFNTFFVQVMYMKDGGHTASQKM